MPQLIQMFIEQYAAQNHKDVIGADEECVKALQAHPWPGNVRQLRNVIERALIICEGRTICTNDLPDPFRVADTSAASYIKMPIGSSLEAVEREIILRTIRLVNHFLITNCIRMFVHPRLAPLCPSSLEELPLNGQGRCPVNYDGMVSYSDPLLQLRVRSSPRSIS